MAKITFELAADITERVGSSELIDLTVDLRGDWLALASDGPSDWRESNGMFARTQSDAPRTLRVLGPDLEIVVADQLWNPHHVRPLPAGHWLLVCGRCRRFPDGTTDLNARVVDSSGSLVREFVLGDGIADVQTTRSGDIVVSYFDEGIFGNFGWSEPMGASGAIRFGADGSKLHDLVPTGEPADMYAMNVVSDEQTWLSWYTDFPICRADGDGRSTEWDSGIPASALAVWKDRAFLVGAYDKFNQLTEVRLRDGGETKVVRKWKLRLPDERKSARPVMFGRGPTLFATLGNKLYRLDCRTL